MVMSIGPQWRPVGTAGVSIDAPVRAYALLPPKWRPATRTDVCPIADLHATAPQVAAMEPDHGDRGELANALVAAGRAFAPRWCLAAVTGMTIEIVLVDWDPQWPQLSPAMAARVSRRGPADHWRLELVSAMEPGLGGQ